MSRIGKQPIAVPAGVKIGVAGQEISVEGPLGKLAWGFRPEVSAVYDEGKKQVLISRNEETRQARALHGLSRAIIANARSRSPISGQEFASERYGFSCNSQ